MAFPSDVAYQQITSTAQAPVVPQSDPDSLESAVNAIVELVSRAKSACIMPGIILARLGLRAEATALVNASGLPFATMMMDKTVLDEAHPQYIGMYAGALAEEGVRTFVEEADCLLVIGALASDFNTGAFTAKLDRSKTVNVMHHRTRVGTALYDNVEMKDILQELTKRLPNRKDIEGPKPSEFGEPKGQGAEGITADTLYPRWSRFLRPDDIVMCESGTSALE